MPKATTLQPSFDAVPVFDLSKYISIYTVRDGIYDEVFIPADLKLARYTHDTPAERWNKLDRAVLSIELPAILHDITDRFFKDPVVMNDALLDELLTESGYTNERCKMWWQQVVLAGYLAIKADTKEDPIIFIKSPWGGRPINITCGPVDVRDDPRAVISFCIGD